MTNIAGTPIDRYCPICNRCEDWLEERRKIKQQVRDSANHIIGYKGATYYAVELVRIVGAILRGQWSVLTVSTYLDGEFGLHDVCLSVPSLVSHNSVERILRSRLPEKEQEALNTSADILIKAIAELETIG